MIASLHRTLTLVFAIVLVGLNTGCVPVPNSAQPTTIAPTTTALPSRPPTATPVPTAMTGLANPASVYCSEQGGYLEMRTTGDGGQIGVCLFADNSLCEEWAFYRGECRPGEQYDSTTIRPDPTGIPAPIGELLALFRANLPANAFNDLAAQPVPTTDGSQLWIVYSTGMRNFDLNPLVPHTLALYTYTDGRWQERGRTTLSTESFTDGPDFVGSVQQVQIAPGRIWLQIEGGIGAHGGSYHLLSFDGTELRTEVAAFSPYPGFGHTEDLDGDGVREVVLNRSEPYIFCYACGVYYPAYQVYRWQDERMVALQISDLTDGQTEPFADLNRQAITSAQADLWADALAAINAAVAQAGTADPTTQAGTLRWNQRLIQMTHTAHMNAIAESAYPLLNKVFAGDYDGAVAEMRAYPPQAIFNAESPLIVGTVAEGWVETLSEYVRTEAEKAAGVAPERAAIYVIWAWGRFLADPTDPAIGTDLERAAQLQPDDPFFTDIAAWWASR
ncbi:putative hemolysin [Chloroflexus aggregans]|uniref:DUF333 domain-containing protein n=1 Tax=Chloroflexus aggregans (strain MD-66 / DSM 9485) TaxID=326427 RepID=B8GCN7_CHLAD|nr:DUF333 domain-containing protein [Chloroflexus aggregans]ACL25081.1 protein of unknown function DUF333 [Chloroflexus aggregans DSM 9485]